MRPTVESQPQTILASFPPPSIKGGAIRLAVQV
jgi:hypothetical protein